MIQGHWEMQEAVLPAAYCRMCAVHAVGLIVCRCCELLLGATERLTCCLFVFKLAYRLLVAC